MLSKKIRAHKEANPKATAKEIAQAIGTSPAYVYQILAPKKPKKAKKQLKPVVPTEGQKIVRSEIERLHAENANRKILNDVNDLLVIELEDEVKQLTNDIIGYRAVISYLQGQLDGVTV
jgi:tRNA A37 N6-isopentenylltransferase MiaA